MIALHVAQVTAPPGTVWIAGTANGLLRVGFGRPPRLATAKAPLERHGLVAVRHSPGPLADAVRSLRAYFAGEAEPTAEIDMAVRTPFAAAVLEAVRRVPFGQVRSFDAIARAVGAPRGARAVGRVLAANPLPIFVPCHRVLRKEGQLAGYIGGRAWKRFLLEIESSQLELARPRRRRRRANG